MKIVEQFNDEYKRKARLFPAIVASTPGVILMWLLANYFLKTCEMVGFLPALIASLAFAVCALEWFGVMVVCWFGRAIESFIFQDGKRFPTTEILLWNNDYLSKQNKKMLRQKIAKDFGIFLLSQQKEDNDEVEARKTIRDAVDRVRKLVGDGRTVLQYNIHYGAVRNLVGGCFFACPLSLCIAIIGCFMNNWPIMYIGVGLSVAFLLPIVFMKLLLKTFGYRYARTLLAEYATI